VSYIDGSYSLLVGHYIDRLGKKVIYIDPLTGDHNTIDAVGVILLAHNAAVTYGYTGQPQATELYCTIPHGSIVVDPWRQFVSDCHIVIHYGNTRHG
jgi:hypothetical protein